MAETSSGIVELVRGIVEPLVDDVDAVEVTSTFTNDGCELVEIRVAAATAGKVIGRQGRIAKAIRTVVKAASSKCDKKVVVEILQ